MVTKSDFTSSGVCVCVSGGGKGARGEGVLNRRPNFVIFVAWSAFFYWDSFDARLERHYKA